VNPTLREIVIAVITAAMTATGLYFQFKGEMATSNVAQNEVTFARIKDLEDRIDVMQRQINELTVTNIKLDNENTQLRVRVGLLTAQIDSGKDGTGVGIVYDLLDSLDVPAWCKKVVRDGAENVVFVMDHLNPRYAFEYGVSYSLYYGKTDFDIFPKSIAAEFYENDMMVLADRDWTDFVELVITASGTKEPRRFWKFWHQVVNGPELVCGWEVP
jgi:cell division protein FtsB